MEKSYTRIAALLFIGALVGCGGNSESCSESTTRTWRIGGTVTSMNGVSDDEVPVGIAAFYCAGFNCNEAPVSNVISIGNSGFSNFPFSLTIDVSGDQFEDLGATVLIMSWRDENENSVRDDPFPTATVTVAPQSTVFGTKAEFEYQPSCNLVKPGGNAGWNVDLEQTALSVDDVEDSGVVLTVNVSALLP